MHILIFALCLILFIFIFGVFLSRNLKVRYYNISDEKTNSIRGFKIVLLSDLHGRYIGKGQSELAQAILKENPDLIIAAGDMVDAYDGAADAASDLAKMLKEKAPFITVRGNHFYKAHVNVQNSLEESFEEYGVISLKNQTYKAEYNGKIIAIDGYDDPIASYEFKNMSKKDILSKNTEVIKKTVSEMTGLNQQFDYRICVCHRPTDVDVFRDAGYDIMLAGHTHGGQWALPFRIQPLGDEVTLFPPKNMQSGMHYHDKMPLIITSGIGFSNIKLRTYLPPEIVVINFK